jgi:two-component system, OmpR family, sensor histidine kinase QseC
MKIKSIRQIILLGVNSVVVVLLIATGFFTYFTAHHEMDEIFDAQLSQYARMIDQFMSSTPPVPEDKLPLVVGVPHIKEDGIERSSAEERRLEGHKYEEKLAFQVWNSKDQLILRSKNAEAVLVAPHEPGYHEIIYNGRHWIFYCVHNPSSGNWIITGQRDDVRNELSLYLAMDQLIPLMIAILPVTILIWLSINWGLKPVRDLSKALATTKPSQLTPLNVELPAELKPFQHAINQLLADLDSYLEKEKRFIASASHELRTPLSILLVHVHNIKNAQNREEIDAAADAISISTRRLSHLVGQLMEVEKLDDAKGLQTTRINLQQLINDSLSLIEINTLNNVSWSIDVSADIEISGNYNLLQAAFRNIFDNAAKYSDPQSEVKITSTISDRVSISIENCVESGIQINPERMGDRFYRHPLSQKVHGAGLGLSIVKKIISMHQATITYTAKNINTLVVRIDF